MDRGSKDRRANQADEAPETVSAPDEAYRAARAQFAARRAYKRALRRAGNPLYFSARSLALLVCLALLACAAKSTEITSTK